MRTLIFVLFAFSTSAFAAGNSFNSCVDVEVMQNRPDFISAGAPKTLKSLKGQELKTALAQAKHALEIFGLDSFNIEVDYTYKLVFLGKKYDALNIDVGGNGLTFVFAENTTKRMNFNFSDGDLYVDGKRCRKVILPSDIQF